MSEQEELAPEVGEVVVPDAPAETEATEQAPNEDQREDIPETEAEAPAEEMTKSKAKRERMKQRVREADARAKAAEAEVARYKAMLGDAKPPQESDYADYEDFRLDTALHNRDQRQADRAINAREQQAQQAREAAKQEAMAVFMESEQDVRAQHADYDHVTRSMPLTDTTLELVMQSDAGPELLYQIGKTPQMAAAFARMDPVSQARELGRLEARLAMPKPKTETSAPDPIKPVKATSRAQKDPSKMTMAEYRKYRGFD